MYRFARSNGCSPAPARASVSGLIRQRRLEAVRRDLADDRFAHLTIAEVAARWCLHDAQWLAKAFRAQFDISPSQFRKSIAADSRNAEGQTAP